MGTDEHVLLAADESGSGRDVVLLHSLALSGQMWREVVPALAAKARAWSVDLRGHGRSPWDGGPFTVADLAGDVAATIEWLGLAEVDLVGVSMGGSVAMQLALDRPDLVRRLVLADTTASYGPDSVSAWAARAATARSEPRDQQFAAIKGRWFSDDFCEHASAEVERIGAIFQACDPAAHAAACGALGGLDLVERLDQIDAPTLVIVGGDDLGTPPAMAEVIVGAIPGARLQVCEGARHLALIERPELWDGIAAHLLDA